MDGKDGAGTVEPRSGTSGGIEHSVAAINIPGGVMVCASASAGGVSLRREGGMRRPHEEQWSEDGAAAAGGSTQHADLAAETQRTAAARWRRGGGGLRRMRRASVLVGCVLVLGLGAADAYKCFEGKVTYCGINADGGALAPPNSKRFVEGMNWACEDQLSNLDPTYIAPYCHGDCATACPRAPAMRRADPRSAGTQSCRADGLASGQARARPRRARSAPA